MMLTRSMICSTWSNSLIIPLCQIQERMGFLHSRIGNFLIIKTNLTKWTLLGLLHSDLALGAMTYSQETKKIRKDPYSKEVQEWMVLRAYSIKIQKYLYHLLSVQMQRASNQVQSRKAVQHVLVDYHAHMESLTKDTQCQWNAIGNQITLTLASENFLLTKYQTDVFVYTTLDPKTESD